MNLDPRNLESLLDDELLTLKEAACALRISRSTIRRLTELGALPCVHFGRALRFRLSDLRLFIADGGTSKRATSTTDRGPPEL